MVKPFELVYGDVVNSVDNEFIEKINNMYLELANTFDFNKTTQKEIVIASIIKDVDDESFTLVDIEGKEVKNIDGYFIKNDFVEIEIKFPANKNNYSNLYLLKGSIVITKTKTQNITVFKLFNNNVGYNCFNYIFEKRYEYFLNFVKDDVYSNCNGIVTDITDKYVEIECDDTKTKKQINIENKQLICQVGDIVKSGQMLTKTYQLNFSMDTGIINKTNKNIPKFLQILNSIYYKGQ